MDKINTYLEAYKNGKITKGLKLGCELDDFLRFKQGSFNMILGRDNVGKTYWRLWYYLVLSTKYDKKWCIWSGENKDGQIVRDLIKIYTGKQIKDLSMDEVFRYKEEVCQWFTFVDNSKLYKFQDLLKIFSDGDYHGCLIDPYTGLERNHGHKNNYEFLNTCREWVNKTNITLDVCLHPVTESGRGGGFYRDGHEWAGHLRHPYKLEAEGGAPFANRCDDYIVLHRLTKHENLKFMTLVYVDKVKDVESGGQQTMIDQPIYCEYNYGLGFKVNGINPLNKPINGSQKELKSELKLELKSKDIMNLGEEANREENEKEF